MKPTLGKLSDGAALAIDVDRLIASRMLITANSGSGKSWALRRLLEQTHGAAQQLVIDPEGEFFTLREKFDYVLAGRAGECPAEPRSAGLLARRLLELGTSAVLDLYELAPRERVRFVRLFLESLIDAPRELWHPVLVIVDEAHAYAPEKGHGEAESVEAVARLMAQGRKRGFAGVLATQRLSKLAKDVAAEANNVLIGRAALDVDIRRSGEALGFSKADAAANLRSLQAGHFFAFGPALCDQVTEVIVGDVQTSHPRAGQRAGSPPPPPRAKVKAILGQLADIPKEAEQEAATAAELKGRVRDLETQLRAAQKANPVPETKVETKTVEVPVVPEAMAKRLEAAVERIEKAIARAAEERGSAMVELNAVRVALARAQSKAPAVLERRPAQPAPVQRAPLPIKRGEQPERAADGAGLSGVEKRILCALAELELLGARQPNRELVAFLAGYTHLQSKGFVNGMSALRTAGLVDYPSGGSVALTEAGSAAATYPDAPRSAAEVQQRVIALLGGASGRILQPLIDAYPSALPREEVASAAGYGHLQSKGFVNAMSRLRTLGFVDYPDRGTAVAMPVLFLEGR